MANVPMTVYVVHAVGVDGVPWGETTRRAVAACGPLGLLAVEAGWVVTELGRQPWVIHKVMRTSDAVTTVVGLAFPFAFFTSIPAGAASSETLRPMLIILAVGAVFLFPAIYLLLRIFKKEALFGGRPRL